MKSVGSVARLSVLIFLFFLLACEERVSPDPSSVTATDGLQESVAHVSAPPVAPTVFGQPDAAFVEMAEEHPSFGGAYFDNGVLHVVSTTGAVPPELSERLPDVATEAISGQFSFVELARWYGPFIEALTDVDWNWTDIDERQNRLTASVEDPQAARRALAEAGIPKAVYELEPATSITITASTLNDSHLPTPGAFGGLALNNSTMAFNVRHWDFGRVAITAAHVTDHFGGNSNNFVGFQGGTRLGPEVFDRPFFPCEQGNCRYSDAAALGYDAENDWQKAKIGRTSGNEGDLELIGKWTVIDEAWNITSGSPAMRTGTTTGQRDGEIHETCVNVDVTEPNEDRNVQIVDNATLLCQFTHSDGTEGGDSGGVVFRKREINNENEVSLLGVIWGAQSWAITPVGPDGDSDAWFSPMTGIRKDLKRDTSLFCSGIETTSNDGCQVDGTGSGPGGGDDCGPHAFQEC